MHASVMGNMLLQSARQMVTLCDATGRTLLNTWFLDVEENNTTQAHNCKRATASAFSVARLVTHQVRGQTQKTSQPLTWLFE